MVWFALVWFVLVCFFPEKFFKGQNVVYTGEGRWKPSIRYGVGSGSPLWGAPRHCPGSPRHSAGSRSGRQPGLSQHSAGASERGEAKLTIRKLDSGMARFSLEALKCQQCHQQGELQLDKKDPAFELVFAAGCSSVILNSSGARKASVSFFFFPLVAYSLSGESSLKYIFLVMGFHFRQDLCSRAKEQYILNL